MKYLSILYNPIHRTALAIILAVAIFAPYYNGFTHNPIVIPISIFVFVAIMVIPQVIKPRGRK